jgi:hypothetical protein
LAAASRHCGATEKGYRVGVMESGRRWPDSAIPKSNWDITKYLWQPDGISRCWGNRAIYHDGWIAATTPPVAP